MWEDLKARRRGLEVVLPGLTAPSFLRILSVKSEQPRVWVYLQNVGDKDMTSQRESPSGERARPVLEGTGKVGYGPIDRRHCSAPFPACLRSCLTFQGDDCT